MDLFIENPNKKAKCTLDDQSRNGFELDSLPSEIAVDILSRLPITSVMRSRFVCKSWHTLSCDQNLVDLHFLMEAKRDPVLIFHCDTPVKNQLYFVEFSDDDDKWMVRKISAPFSGSMPEFKVVGSCNGLLCLFDSLFDDLMYVYNPFTRDYVELPKSRQFHEQEVVCGFGFCQGTKEYKVVKIVYFPNVDIGSSLPTRRMRFVNRTKSEIMVFSLGSNSWRSVGKAPYKLERKSPDGLFINGRLHWLSSTVVSRRMINNFRARLIVSFDLADEQFHEVAAPDFGVRVRRNYELAVMGECLAAVVYTSAELEIWVMKEYDVKESWIKEVRFGVQVPKMLKPSMFKPFRMWRNTFGRRLVRVVCVLKNGGILVEFRVGMLGLYDPESGVVRDIRIQGMPNMFLTFVHIGSLNRMDMDPVGV